MKKILYFIVILILIFVALNYNNLRKTILINIYPIEYSEQVELYSKKYNVDSNLIYAIIKAESNFVSDAESSKGAKGLMQLMYSTATEIAEKIDLNVDEESIMEPDVNINLGTKYISILIDKYEDIGLALAAYNAGSGNVNSWIEDGTLQEDGSDIENIPFKETNNYVRKILRDYDIYKELYGDD